MVERLIHLYLTITDKYYKTCLILSIGLVILPFIIFDPAKNNTLSCYILFLFAMSLLGLIIIGHKNNIKEK